MEESGTAFHVSGVGGMSVMIARKERLLPSWEDLSFVMVILCYDEISRTNVEGLLDCCLSVVTVVLVVKIRKCYSLEM